MLLLKQQSMTPRAVAGSADPVKMQPHEEGSSQPSSHREGKQSDQWKSSRTGGELHLSLTDFKVR